jgi:hypothetical protein
VPGHVLDLHDVVSLVQCVTDKAVAAVVDRDFVLALAAKRLAGRNEPVSGIEPTNSRAPALRADEKVSLTTRLATRGILSTPSDRPKCLGQ